ncbi:hypothetical protein BDP27DRAFT_1314065 [Rhodocollybia butyracea]|uniref:Secreted protein n=1 Tax=Rhodocollybia butyracea TaxID=206335 RepID=A0A9P5Q7F8_9AGAR|nr:hypothetical protein BDP27DRAFT_1314065 [Rhodocollybia butyracea]
MCSSSFLLVVLLFGSHLACLGSCDLSPSDPCTPCMDSTSTASYLFVLDFLSKTVPAPVGPLCVVLFSPQNTQNKSLI